MSPKLPPYAVPEIETDPTLRIVEEGLPAGAPSHSWLRRHSKAVSIVFGVTVTAALIVGIYNNRADFVDAVNAASFGVLAAATAMQVVWLIARSEAWHVCVDAAGGNVERRPPLPRGRHRLPRQPLQQQLRGRRPDRRPAPLGTRALPQRLGPVAAELPIVVIEMALAAIFAFTLVEPLGARPGGRRCSSSPRRRRRSSAVSRVARKQREGFWRGSP